MAEAHIPVRYVGLAPHTTDHLYGSKVAFSRGKVSQVPAWAAAQLLRHPEFEDARPKDTRGQPILAKREISQEELDRDLKELEALEAHVRLDTMTREQMSAYVMRTYGVRIDATGLKADVTAAARNMMQRGR